LLERSPDSLEIRSDPNSLAPEKLLVFELKGEVRDFAAAARRIDGLDVIDEAELEASGPNKPVAYLFVPDHRALSEILSLWNRWLSGVTFPAVWRDFFQTLEAIRPWGPDDRVDVSDRQELRHELEQRKNDQLIAIEVELVWRIKESDQLRVEENVSRYIVSLGGKIKAKAKRAEIVYHALLAALPPSALQQVVDLSRDGLAYMSEVFCIRPQSRVEKIELIDIEEAALQKSSVKGNPILAVFDGFPIASHSLLDGRVIIDDFFDLEDRAVVQSRVHGTAMASLVVHGDLNRSEAPLPRPIHIVPFLVWNGDREETPEDALPVDMTYEAVMNLKKNSGGSASDVVIINLSLGNERLPFHGKISAWARLIDYLSWSFGILFIISAGNMARNIIINDVETSIEFESMKTEDRSKATLFAINSRIAERRLISPAESVNGVTVGAANIDYINARSISAGAIDPFPDLTMPNPSSRVGPGFARSVKPDVLLPGSREHIRVMGNDNGLTVRPIGPARQFGLKVAAPPRDVAEQVAFSGGSSAAAALASRTAHRIHDALEQSFAEEFLTIPNRQRAVLLKALLVHPAVWDKKAVELIRSTIGPSEGKKNSELRDNIRRYLGYGTVESDNAVACASDRATFWVTGRVARESTVEIAVPIPLCFGGIQTFRSISATLAWFTPVLPGRRAYRAVRLTLFEDNELKSLRLKAATLQPNANQIRRGTVLSRRWETVEASPVGEEMFIKLTVQREIDQVEVNENEIPFGLAVTLAMPGEQRLYEEVRQRIESRARALS